jgi:flagellar biosynthesis chaperone FliJ
MSGIQTVARVARLRERAARARYAMSRAETLRADQVFLRRSAELDGLLAPEDATAEGTSFAGWQASTARQAVAVTDARRSAQEAAGAQTAALADWQDLSRRREALDEVVLRWKATRRADADAAAQRLMDDLGKRREGWA